MKGFENQTENVTHLPSEVANIEMKNTGLFPSRNYSLFGSNGDSFVAQMDEAME